MFRVHAKGSRIFSSRAGLIEKAKIWNARHWKLDFIEAIDEFLTRTPNT